MNRHDTSTLQAHDADFYAWTQRQAKLLRALRQSGANVPPDLDISNLAEEIEDLGKAELRGATSLIRQIMIHLIKAAADPQASALAHWRAETSAFHIDLLSYFEPSMRRKINLTVAWKHACEQAELDLLEHGMGLPRGLPSDCPFTLQDFVRPDFKFDRALAQVQ